MEVPKIPGFFGLAITYGVTAKKNPGISRLVAAGGDGLQLL
jgi:hypothetical protein